MRSLQSKLFTAQIEQLQNELKKAQDSDGKKQLNIELKDGMIANLKVELNDMKKQHKTIEEVHQKAIAERDELITSLKEQLGSVRKELEMKRRSSEPLSDDSSKVFRH